MLGFELRKKGSPHNCLDDACAAMKLAIEKVEHDVDNVIPFVREKVASTHFCSFPSNKVLVTYCIIP